MNGTAILLAIVINENLFFYSVYVKRCSRYGGVAGF